MSIRVRPYETTDQPSWDEFARTSKNGTFLFLRGYMDYHADRFHDHSLMLFRDDRLVALLPANRAGDEVHSHQGLTYGGLVTSSEMTTSLAIDAVSAVCAHLRASGVRRLFYKTIPWIYHRLPSDEDRYALFRAGAVLERRDVLSVITPAHRVAEQERRRRGAAKARKSGLTVGRSDEWPGYWAMLSAHLNDRFGSTPVHTLDEIEKLRRAFPQNISLHAASLSGAILAGVVVYESETVARTQYIASSEAGRAKGALDLLILSLVGEAFADKPFIDLGSSNGAEPGSLNQGLIEQKEGFGARAIAHDFYSLAL